MKNLLVIALVALVFYMLMRKPATAAPAANADVYIPVLGTTATPTSYTPASTAVSPSVLNNLSNYQLIQ